MSSNEKTRHTGIVLSVLGGTIVAVSLLLEHPPWNDVGYDMPHLLFALGILIVALGIGTIMVQPATLTGVTGVIGASYLVLASVLTLVWGFLIQFDWAREVVILQQLSLTLAFAPYIVGYVAGWEQAHEPQRFPERTVIVTTTLSAGLVGASWVLATNAVFEGTIIGSLFSFVYIYIFVIIGAIGSTILYLLWVPPIVQRLCQSVPI